MRSHFVEPTGCSLDTIAAGPIEKPDEQNQAGFIMVMALALCSRSSVSAQDQPRLRKALAPLPSARAQLAPAGQDKGGHRARALEVAERARAEMQAGMTPAR